MTMFARLHELLSTLEDSEADSSTFCEEFVQVLQQCLKNSGDTLEGQLTAFTWAINLFKKVRPKLPNTDEVDHMTCTLFQACARTILNEGFPQVGHTPALEAFVVAVNQAYLELHSVGYSHRFAMLQYLMKHHWHHPVLVAMLLAEPIDQDIALQYVSSGEFPELFHLRIQMLLQQGCEDFALNLCNWCVQHKKFKHDAYVRGNQLVLMYERGFVEQVYEECRLLPCCVGAQVVQCLRDDKKKSDIYLDLAQTFLIKDWLKPRKYCCTKELLALWLDGRHKADTDDKSFLYNVGKLLETAANTWQLMALLDTMHIMFGKKYIQFYMEVCVLALTVDKYNLDLAECKEDKVLKELSLGSLTFTCTMISSLTTDWCLEMRKWSMLTALSLEAKKDVYHAVKKLYALPTEEHDRSDESDSEQHHVNGAQVKDVEEKKEMEKPISHPLLSIRNVKDETTKAILRILTSLKLAQLKPLLQWKELKSHCLKVLSSTDLTEEMAEEDKVGAKQPNGVVVGTGTENGHVDANAMDHSYTSLRPIHMPDLKKSNNVLTSNSCLPKSPMMSKVLTQVTENTPTVVGAQSSTARATDTVGPTVVGTQLSTTRAPDTLGKVPEAVTGMPGFSSLQRKTFQQSPKVQAGCTLLLAQPDLQVNIMDCKRAATPQACPTSVAQIVTSQALVPVAQVAGKASTAHVLGSSKWIGSQVVVLKPMESKGLQSEIATTNAIVSQASMSQVVMSQAVMSQAVMSQAVMSQASMSQASVYQAVMSQASMSQSVMSQVVTPDLVVPQAVASQEVMSKAVVSLGIASESALLQPVAPQTATVSLQTVMPEILDSQALTVEPVMPEVLKPHPLESGALGSTLNHSKEGELNSVAISSSLSVPVTVKSKALTVMDPSDLPARTVQLSTTSPAPDPLSLRVCTNNSNNSEQSQLHHISFARKVTRPLIIKKNGPDEKQMQQTVIQQQVQQNIQSPGASFSSNNVIPIASVPSQVANKPKLVHLQPKTNSKIQMVMPKIVSSTLRQSSSLMHRFVSAVQNPTTNRAVTLPGPLTNRLQSSGLTIVSGQSNVVKLKLATAGPAGHQVIPKTIEQSTNPRILPAQSLRVVTDIRKPRPRSSKLLPAKLMMPAGLRVPMEMKVVNYQQMPSKLQPVFVSTATSSSSLVSSQSGQGVQTIKLSGQEEVQAILQGFMNRSGPNTPSVAQVKDPTRRFFKTRTLTLSPAALQNMLPGWSPTISKDTCSSVSATTPYGTNMAETSAMGTAATGSQLSEHQDRLLKVPELPSSNDGASVTDRNIFSILSSSTAPAKTINTGTSKSLDDPTLVYKPEHPNQGIDYSVLRTGQDVTQPAIRLPNFGGPEPQVDVALASISDSSLACESSSQNECQVTGKLGVPCFDGHADSFHKASVNTLDAAETLFGENHQMLDHVGQSRPKLSTVRAALPHVAECSGQNAATERQTFVGNPNPSTASRTQTLTIVPPLPDVTSLPHSLNTIDNVYNGMQVLRAPLDQVTNATLLAAPQSSNTTFVPGLQMPLVMSCSGPLPTGTPTYPQGPGSIQLFSNPVIQSMPSVIAGGVVPVVSTPIQQRVVPANSSFVYGFPSNLVLGLGPQLGGSNILQVAAPASVLQHAEPMERSLGASRTNTGSNSNAVGSHQNSQVQDQSPAVTKWPKNDAGELYSSDDEVMECDASGNPVASSIKSKRSSNSREITSAIVSQKDTLESQPMGEIADQSQRGAESGEADSNSGLAEYCMKTPSASPGEPQAAGSREDSDLLPSEPTGLFPAQVGIKDENAKMESPGDVHASSKDTDESSHCEMYKETDSTHSNNQTELKESSEVKEDMLCPTISSEEGTSVTRPCAEDSESQPQIPCQHLQSPTETIQLSSLNQSSLSPPPTQPDTVNDAQKKKCCEDVSKQNHCFTSEVCTWQEQSADVLELPEDIFSSDVKVSDGETECGSRNSEEETNDVPSSDLPSEEAGTATFLQGPSLQEDQLPGEDAARNTTKGSPAAEDLKLFDPEEGIMGDSPTETDSGTHSNSDLCDQMYSTPVSRSNAEKDLADSSFESLPEEDNQACSNDNPMVDVSTQTDDDDEYNSDAEVVPQCCRPPEGGADKEEAPEDSSSVCTVDDGGSHTSGSQTELLYTCKGGDYWTADQTQGEQEKKSGQERRGEDGTPSSHEDTPQEEFELPLDLSMHGNEMSTSSPSFSPVQEEDNNECRSMTPKQVDSTSVCSSEGSLDQAPECVDETCTSNPEQPDVSAEDNSGRSVTTSPDDDFICVDESDEEILFHRPHKVEVAASDPTSHCSSDQQLDAEADKTLDVMYSGSGDHVTQADGASQGSGADVNECERTVKVGQADPDSRNNSKAIEAKKATPEQDGKGNLTSSHSPKIISECISTAKSVKIKESSETTKAEVLASACRQTDPSGVNNGNKAAEGRRKHNNGNKAAEGRRKHGTWNGYKWVFSPDKKNQGTGRVSASTSPRAKVKADCKALITSIDKDQLSCFDAQGVITKIQEQGCTQRGSPVAKVRRTGSPSLHVKQKEPQIPDAKTMVDSNKSNNDSMAERTQQKTPKKRRCAQESPVMPLRKSTRKSTQLDSTASASLRRAIKFSKTENQMLHGDGELLSSGRSSRSPAKTRISGNARREMQSAKSSPHNVKTCLKGTIQRHANKLSTEYKLRRSKSYESSTSCERKIHRPLKESHVYQKVVEGDGRQESRTQSSCEYEDDPSRKALPPSPESEDTLSESCSTTEEIDVTPTKKMSLERPVLINRLKNSPGFVPEVVERKTRFGFLRHPEREEKGKLGKKKANVAQSLRREQTDVNQRETPDVQARLPDCAGDQVHKAAAAVSSAAAVEAAHRRSYQQLIKSRPNQTDTEEEPGEKCMCHTLPSKYKCWNPSCPRNAQLDTVQVKRSVKNPTLEAVADSIPRVVDGDKLKLPTKDQAKKKHIKVRPESKTVHNVSLAQCDQPQPTRIIEVGHVFRKTDGVVPRKTEVCGVTPAKSSCSPKARIVGDNVITVQPQLISRAFDTWLSGQNHAASVDKTRPVLKQEVATGSKYSRVKVDKTNNSSTKPKPTRTLGEQSNIRTGKAAVVRGKTAGQMVNRSHQSKKSGIVQSSKNEQTNVVISESEISASQNNKKRSHCNSAADEQPAVSKKTCTGKTEEESDEVNDSEKHRSLSDHSDTEDPFGKAFSDWTKGESDPTEVRYAHIKTYSRNGRTKVGTASDGRPSSDKQDYQGAFQEWISDTKSQ